MITKENLSFKILNKKLFIIVIVLGMLFFGSQILVTSRVGTKSSEIDDIRSEKDTLRLENEIMRSKINEARSTKNLSNVVEKYKLTEKFITEIEVKNNIGVASR